MYLQDAIRKRIENLITLNNTNGNKLSLDAGISRSCINKFLRHKTKRIQLDSLALICEALNVSLTEFFDDELFKDIEVND